MNTFLSNFKLSFRPDSVPTPSAIIVTQALPHYGEEINLESQYVTLAAFIKNCIIPAGLWPWEKTKSKRGNENQMVAKLMFQQNSEKIPSKADTKVKWRRALGKVRFKAFKIALPQLTFHFHNIPSVYACWRKCLKIEIKSSGLQAAENKDSVHLRFAFPTKAPIKYPKPEDVAITSTAMTGGTKGIVLYQLQKDKIFDHTKIDFASLTLPTLVKSTEPKPK